LLKFLYFVPGSSNLSHILISNTIYPTDKPIMEQHKEKVFIQSLTPCMTDHKCELFMNMHHW
jgi:hypothetical protein